MSSGTLDLGATFGSGGLTINGLSGPAFTITAGSGISIASAGSNITITATGGGGTVTNVTASAPLASSGGITPNISFTGILALANGGTGSATQNFVDLTTNQTIGGNKTFTGIVLASNFTGSSSGTNTGDVTIGTANGLSLAGQVLSLGLSSTTTTGALSSADWNTFNNKGSGTVTSVALTVPGVIFNSPVSGSPITTSGTLALALNTQIANTVFAGPASGGVATPTFRPLVAADIPSLTAATISNFTTATQTVASGSATKKVIYVSQDVGSDSNDGSIFLPFLTIQAGINKANTIAAYAAQVVVIVTPPAGGGGYTENITLSQQGVHLQCVAPLLRTDACLIIGTITVNLTGTSGGVNYIADSNDVYINGFVTSSGAGNAITFSGTAYQRLWISNCFVQALGGGSALVVSNTGVSSGGTKSTITSYDVTYLSNSAVNPTVLLTAGRCWNYGVNAAIQNNAASSHSIDQSGTTSFICNTVGITGQVNVTSNVANATITTSTIASGSLPAIATPASPNTGVIVIGNVGITTTAANSMTGAGVLVFAGANVKLSSGGDAAPAITQVVFPKFPEGQTLLGAKATAVTNSLLVLKNGHITSQQTTPPTIVVGANAGTGSSASLARATDVAGEITIVTGTVGLSTGSYATITFNKLYSVAPIIVISPAGSTLSTSVYVTATTTAFDINFAIAGGVSSTYKINYHVIETQ